MANFISPADLHLFQQLKAQQNQTTTSSSSSLVRVQSKDVSSAPQVSSPAWFNVRTRLGACHATDEIITKVFNCRDKGPQDLRTIKENHQRAKPDGQRNVRGPEPFGRLVVREFTQFLCVTIASSWSGSSRTE